MTDIPADNGFEMYLAERRRKRMVKNIKLSRKQRGTYAEYRVISELIKLGFDVYTPCVDERGIDCIIRTNKGKRKYYDIQIKKCERSVSIRGALPIFTYLENNPDNYFMIAITIKISRFHPAAKIVFRCRARIGKVSHA